MKRKIIAMIMTVFMLLATVGCSTEGLNLYGEIKKASAWECEETKGNVAVALEAPGVKVSIGAQFDGYVNTKETNGMVKMTINKLDINAEGNNISISPTKIAPVTMYIDKQIIYISKGYFTDLFAVSGAPVPKALKDIKAEYIGLDASKGTGAVSFDQKKSMELFEKLFVGSKVELPVTQNGREYTIELNADQMIDLSAQFAKEMLNSIDEINKISNTGITQKDIDAEKEEIEAGIEQFKTMAKPAIAGSKATVKYAFTDSAYTQNFDTLIKFAFGGETGSMKITTQSEAKKVAKKDFSLPTSKVVYTMDKFMELFMPVPEPMAYINQDKIITKNKVSYIPLKETMSQLDCAVVYNAKIKKVTVKVDGKELPVQTITQKGTSYVALTQLSKLGFSFTKDASGVVVTRKR
jgi:hypothetical protein